MSNKSGDGITDVKAKACDILLDQRLTQKAKDPKKAEAIMDKLHIAQPKKRDNKMRDICIPDTVKQGLKKTGPTVKEIMQEYGGAGKFVIPEEEFYILEKEDWRYDKWPEFFQGKNVADYYDPEIEQKLNALEEEEAQILAMEAENDQMEDDSDSSENDGVTMDDLKKSVDLVRGKINIIKQRTLLKAKRRARSKIRNFEDMAKDLMSKGIEVNKDSLATRVRNPKRIGDLEAAQDKKAKAMLGDSSDDADDEVLDDEELRDEEQKYRGRKGREMEEKQKKRLGKRGRDDDSDVDMEDEDSDKSDGKDVPRAIGGSLSKRNRTMTPEQRAISVKKILRDRSSSRREGNEPQRLAYKIVPEEQVKLSKKING